MVLVYGPRRQAPALHALARAVSGPFDPVLARAGQAVILDRRPGAAGGSVIALAWRHAQRVATPSDPRLGAFASYWLGRGAPGAPGGA